MSSRRIRCVPVRCTRDENETESDGSNKKNWKMAIEKKREEMKEIRRTLEAMVENVAIDMSFVCPLTLEDLLGVPTSSRSFHYCILCDKTFKGNVFNHLNSAHNLAGDSNKSERDALSAVSAGVMEHKKGLQVDMRQFKSSCSEEEMAIHRQYWRILEQAGVPVLNKTWCNVRMEVDDEPPADCLDENVKLETADSHKNQVLSHRWAITKTEEIFSRVFDVPFFTVDEVHVRIVDRTVIVECKREVYAVGVESCFLRYSIELPDSIDISTVQTTWNKGQITLTAERMLQ